MASLTKDLPPLPANQSTEQPQKPPAGVFRRLTSRLRSPSQSWVHVSAAQAPELECVQEGAPTSPKKEKSKRKGTNPLLSLPPSAIAHRKPGTELENSFTSAEQRQAALRAMGLVPATARPGRDAHGYKVPLSEQETHLDQLYAVTPGDVPTSAGEQESEAQKIKEAWLKKNSEMGVAEGSRTSRDTSRSPERARRPAEPRWQSPVAVEEAVAIDQPLPPPPPPPQPLMTAEQVRARRKDDPVFAPSGLLAAMQAYRPENYQRPPGRKPSAAYAMQQRRGGQDSDSDSDASV